MTVATSASSGANAVAGTQVSYAYDSMLRRQAVTASRLVDSTMTSFTTTGYTYDAASRLKSVTDGINYATYNYVASSGGMIDNVVYGVDTTVGANDDGIWAPTTTMFTTTKHYDQLGRFVSHQSVRADDSAVLSSYGYTYNQRGQRAQAQMTDGSYWDYQYDSLGQLTGAAKFTALPSGGGKILPGYQYNYHYDQIGNRTKASSGGDPFGLNLRDTTYQSNALNQYTQINNHPYANVTGQAHADSTVTVQLDENQPAIALKPGGFNPRVDATDLEKRTAQTARIPIPDSDDSYFHAEFQVDTSASGTSGARTELDLTVTGIRNAQGPNGEDAIDTKAVKRQVPASTVTLTYDDDGNLLSDDRWTYIWNGENRLIELQPKPFYRADLAILTKRLEFTYDSQGRRIEKRVYAYNATTQQHDTLESITRFLYDGWLLIAELQKPGDSIPGVGSPLRTYTHGLDLSGTNEGAGGIAGLLFARTVDQTSSGNDEVYAYCYDGNGNVTDLLQLKPGDFSPQGSYEYSPFGQLIRATGTATETNPFLFSTKYTDEETGFCYYGYRYYDSMMGRWLNRDPLQEVGGSNLLAYTQNNNIDYSDILGLSLLSNAKNLFLKSCNGLKKGASISLAIATPPIPALAGASLFGTATVKNITGCKCCEVTLSIGAEWDLTKKIVKYLELDFAQRIPYLGTYLSYYFGKFGFGVSVGFSGTGTICPDCWDFCQMSVFGSISIGRTPTTLIHRFGKSKANLQFGVSGQISGNYNACTGSTSYTLSGQASFSATFQWYWPFRWPRRPTWLPGSVFANYDLGSIDFLEGDLPPLWFASGKSCK